MMYNFVTELVSEFLFAAKATLSRLNRCVSEEELDLSECCRDMTEPGECAAQIALKSQLLEKVSDLPAIFLCVVERQLANRKVADSEGVS